MQGIRDITGLFGNASALAASLNAAAEAAKRPNNYKADTVSRWPLRGRIPEESFADLIDAAAEKGAQITVETLLGLNKPRANAWTNREQRRPRKHSRRRSA